MNQINNINQFSENSHITYFTGKNYDDAIKEAVEWSKRTGATLLSYYKQIAFGKSILVSYKRKEEAWQSNSVTLTDS